MIDRTKKDTKAEAHYKPNVKTHHCDTCINWRERSCVKVAGSISPIATCDYYSKGRNK